jgi:hypothetical protein
MTNLSQILMFWSSYAPLLAVFAILDSFGRGLPSLICAVAAALGFAMPMLLRFGAARLQPQPLHVDTAQIRDGDTLAYIATYLVPFAAIAAPTARERIALGVFFAVLAVLYVRNELFYVNPMLALFGYRLFQGSSPTGASVVLLSHRRFLKSGTELSARRLSGYVYWEAKR